MKRWSGAANERVEVPEVDAFLAEIEAVCRKHGMTISHEDGHGAFLVEPMSERNLEWLREARDERDRS